MELRYPLDITFCCGCHRHGTIPEPIVRAFPGAVRTCPEHGLVYVEEVRWRLPR